MDLDLDIASLLSPGRRAEPLTYEVVRALRPADFISLTENRKTEPADLERISARHHKLAQMISLGNTVNECAAELGYTPSRISNLKRSKPFQEILEMYMEMGVEKHKDLHEEIAIVNLDLVRETGRRIAEEPETISNKDLIDLGKTYLDRGGYAPTVTSVNVNVAADMGDRLEEARKRAKQLARTIDNDPGEQVGGESSVAPPMKLVGATEAAE